MLEEQLLRHERTLGDLRVVTATHTEQIRELQEVLTGIQRLLRWGNRLLLTILLAVIGNLVHVIWH